MPRPILSDKKQNINMENKNSLNLKSKEISSKKINQKEFMRLLRHPRRQEYIEALQQFDLSGHTLSTENLDRLIETFRNEFEGISFAEAQLIGIVAKCYLGESYEVHTLDLIGEIVTHYKMHESLPPLMERARGLALFGGYEFIEVYVDKLVAVSKDGTVAIV